MLIITYNGPEPISPPVAVAPASELSLPRGVPCEVDDEHAALLLTADPVAFELQATVPSTTKDKKGATP